MSNPAHILVLGATSAIAQAYARRRAPEGARFVLAGRHRDRLGAIAADLVACGATAAKPFVADLAALDSIAGSISNLQAGFDPFDEVLVAFGMLGEQAVLEQDLAAARGVIETNLTGPTLWILSLLKDKDVTRPLVIVAIGSVAGDRGRASNYVYGAAKGGLDRFLEGLAQKYDGTAVKVITVKPGFVDTPMTAAISKGGPLWACPDRIAADIHRAVTRRKRVVYAPWFWWPIMTIIRHLPWFVFRRLKV